MMNIDFEAFREWQLAGKRHVNIKFGEYSNAEQVSIFVYDYELEMGQIVTSVVEIDLVSKKIESLKRDMKRWESLNQ